MEKKRRIYDYFQNAMLATAFLTLLVVSGIWAINRYSEFRDSRQRLHADYLEQRQQLVRGEVERAVNYIDQLRASRYNQMRNDLRLQVRQASALIALHLQHYRDHHSLDEQKSMLHEALRILDEEEERMIQIFTVQADPELTPVTGQCALLQRLQRDAPEQAARLRDEILLRARDGGRGYVLPAPHDPTSRDILYIQAAPEVDWIIGAELNHRVYRDHLQAEILASLQQQYLEHSDYLFAGTWDGVSLLGPAPGVNVLRSADADAAAIVTRLIDIAKRGEGFAEYTMPRLGGLHSAPKISYVRGIADWQWYIGAGVYIDEIEHIIASRERELRQRLLSRIPLVSGGILLLLCFVYWRTRRASDRIQDQFNRFSAFLGRVPEGRDKVDPDSFSIEEFVDLAKAGNAAIDARAETEEHFQHLLEHAPIPIAVFSADGTMHYLNRQFEEVFGYRQQELPDRSAWLARARPEPSDTHAASPNADAAREVRVTCRDGSHRYMTTAEATIGNLTLTFFVDTTARRAIENDLRHQREEAERARSFLLAALETSPAGILFAEAPSGRITFANAAALSIHGPTTTDLLDIPIEKHAEAWHIYRLDGTPCPSEELPLSRAIQQQESSHSEEYLVRRDDGTERHLLVNAAPVYDSDGQHVAGTVVFLDVTEERQIEAELRHSQKMDSIGQLAGGIAHDFNNQLTAIMGYAEYLQLRLQQQDLGHELGEIIAAGNRAADLTAQLLAFARRGQFQRTRVDLHDLVSTVVDILAHTIDHRIQVRAQLDAPHHHIMGDEGQLQNAVLNIALNARDAMPDGGTITFTSAIVQYPAAEETPQPTNLEPGPHLHLGIHDTGTGIAPAHLDRIFEPFFTTKPQGKGTGMGLAAAYGSIHKHGGDILVTSSLGEGTTFHLWLPLADETVAQAAKPSPPTLAPPDHHDLPQEPPTILIVDNEELVRNMLANFITACGYRALTAADGQQAIDIHRQHADTISLVFLDMIMPVMNGTDAFRILHQAAPDLPIIIISGYSLNGAAQALLDQGAVAFVQKPFRLNELETLIHRHATTATQRA